MNRTKLKIEPVTDILMFMSKHIIKPKRTKLIRTLKELGYKTDEQRSDLYFKILTCNRVDQKKLANKIKNTYINLDKEEV